MTGKELENELEGWEKEQLAENMRFYADMRFKQLTLLMAGMTLAAAGVAQYADSTATIGNSGARIPVLLAVFALFFVGTMWIMEVRATLFWASHREKIRYLWPNALSRHMRWVNSTNALLLFHAALYFAWLWVACKLTSSCWLLIGLGVGVFLVAFSICSYRPLWSHMKKPERE